MSKTKKSFKSNSWADPEDNDDYDYYDYKSAKDRRRQKQLANVLRSKNIERLMELEDDEE
jgi:hypothetical protein